MGHRWPGDSEPSGTVAVLSDGHRSPTVASLSFRNREQSPQPPAPAPGGCVCVQDRPHQSSTPTASPPAALFHGQVLFAFRSCAFARGRHSQDAVYLPSLDFFPALSVLTGPAFTGGSYPALSRLDCHTPYVEAPCTLAPPAQFSAGAPWPLERFSFARTLPALSRLWEAITWGNVSAVPRTTAHGATGRTRTGDILPGAVLYQLSYHGICAAGKKTRTPPL